MRLPTKSKSESYSETSDADEVGIRWKDNTLIRGGLTDMALRKSWSKACREKSADAIVVEWSITLREGQNLIIER